MLGLLLAIGASIAWAGLDASRKSLARDLAPTVLVILLTFGQAPSFALWAAAAGRWMEAGYALPGLSCLALNVLSNVGFVKAVKVSPLSLTIPFLSLTPVFTTLVAIPLLGELPTPLQLAGIATVVVGAMLLHAGSIREEGLLGPLRAFLRERGSVLMTLVALMWSLTAALDKRALEHASVGAHALVQTGGIGAVLLLWLAAQRRLGELRGIRARAGAYVVAVAFATAALGLQLLAIQHVLVALVETIKRALGMISSIVLGRLLFAEPITRSKIAAIVLMTLGTAALLWPA